MVSINGLPPSGVNRANSLKKAKKQQQDKPQPADTTPVAQAVSRGIRQLNEADIDSNRLQYDLPEGRSRRALEEYFDVMNQAKREELMQMLGVDLYV